MKVAMYVLLVLCALIAFVGVAVWWTPCIFILKLIWSILLISTAIAFGAITIEFIKDW